MTKAAFLILALLALLIGVAQAEDRTTGVAKDPMVDACIRAQGLLVPGSEAWVGARHKAVEKREAQTPARPPQKAQPQRSRPLYLKLTHGSPALKTVALTFDDGPHPEFTPELLAVLDKYNVKATFFVVGKMAQKNPGLVLDIQAAGHEIGDHTFSHVNVARLSEEGAAAEWKAGEKAITAITGGKVKYCRPPGGRYDREAVIAASELGLTTVLWTDNSADYLGMSAGRLERRVLSRVSRGGIILMHDGVQQTIEVLPRIIERLRSKGYRFLTLSQLQAETKKQSSSPRARS
jgi:peptidoglycan/xylan/chitin deacetylase (PgdA/CDA1 family)